MIDFNDINVLLRNHSGMSYWYGNAIPEKKLRNARIYMSIPNGETVYALYDNTIFGSAKEGACFTERGIYGRYSSGNESITYEELAKLKITYSDAGYLRFAGKQTIFSGWFDKLLVELNKLYAPIDIKDAKYQIRIKKEFRNGIELLEAQEKYVKNTPENEIIDYRKLYIEAYMGLNEILTAEKLLKDFKKLRDAQCETEFISNIENTINDFYEEYNRDLETFKSTIMLCKDLAREGKYEEAYTLFNSLKLRGDFSQRLKAIYYKVEINILILNEKLDTAETSIESALENSFISTTEMDNYANRVLKMRELLHEKYVQEQRDVLAKNIEMAKMYEKHGVLESASDTINAAISAAPVELANEKTEAFKTLVELLLSQYEYEQIYELRDFYRSISKDELLGYNLYDLVETHRSGHIEEYYTHLYEKAIYYMQSGKFEEAHMYIDDAKSIKCTFDVRCAEINLAILELKYLESRSLLDALIQDKAQFADNSDFSESIELFEKQYADMIGAISTMLKIYAITDNVDAAMDNDGYANFVDHDGLNLLSIAARYTNHNIIDSIVNNNNGSQPYFSETNDGFRIVFFAAMQLDYSAFSAFIRKRLENGSEAFTINHKLNVIYKISEEINNICEEDAISYEEATEKAIKELYNECVLFYICLLNEDCYDSVCAMLEKTKEKQITLVEKMKEELPELLAKIDDECNEKCNHLREAANSIKSLLLDVPESREEKADTVASELADAIGSAVEFANKNVQIIKNEKEWAVNVNSQYIDKIQEKIDIWKSIDRDAVKKLFDIPSAAISFGEYDESNKQISLSLVNCSTKTTMSPSIISLLAEHPEQVMIEPNVEFEYDDGKEFKAVHKYSYSVGDDKCIVEFVNVAQLDGSESVVDKLVNIILQNKEA